MGSQKLIVFSVLVVFLLNVSWVLGATIAEECSEEAQNVMSCLSYATGKAPTPTKDCCDKVEDMKEKDPKCLCFVMQQTHNGSQTIKQLGIQENRLLQLPSACHLQNASISFCPKLLGLAPNSPDAAIFTNASTSTPTTTGATGTSNNDSSGNQYRPFFPGSLAIAVAIFIYIFSAGSSCML